MFDVHLLSAVEIAGAAILAAAGGARIDTPCLLYTSAAATERFSVDFGGAPLIIKKTH